MYKSIEGGLIFTPNSQMSTKVPENLISQFDLVKDGGILTVDNSKVITEDTIEKLLEEKLKKLNNNIIQCKCHNCGAALSVDYNKPIIVCKYCNSTYIMGNARVNDSY